MTLSKEQFNKSKETFAHNCNTVNSGSELVGAKHVSEINICWSTCIGKSKERKIFDFLHCPFEPPAKQHRPVSQLGWILWCMLARPSKGQCRNSKIFPPLLLTVKVDQNIFFPETCFASTISEPEFTVCCNRVAFGLHLACIWRALGLHLGCIRVQLGLH